MKLKMKYDSQDDIPEQLQEYYTEHRDGSFRLAVEDPDGKLSAAVSKAAVDRNIKQGSMLDVLTMLAKDELTVKDGRFVVQKGGEIQYNSAGEPMSVDDWMGEKVKSFPNWFKADSRGSGAVGSGGTKSGPTWQRREDMSTREKVQFISEFGREAFEKLPL